MKVDLEKNRLWQKKYQATHKKERSIYYKKYYRNHLEQSRQYHREYKIELIKEN